MYFFRLFKLNASWRFESSPDGVSQPLPSILPRCRQRTRGDTGKNEGDEKCAAAAMSVTVSLQIFPKVNTIFVRLIHDACLYIRQT